VLRDVTRWNCDFSDRQFYADLRQLIEQTQLPSVDLFRLEMNAHWLPTPTRIERAELAESVVTMAESEDLRVERLVLDGTQVYARFRLDDGGRGPSLVADSALDRRDGGSPSR
jgi:hypothetical protein